MSITPSKIPVPQAPFTDPETGYLTRVGNNYLTSLTQNANAAAGGTVTTDPGSGLAGGGVVADGISLSIAANGVTNEMIRQSTAYSVIGRAFGTDGDVADITATADNRVLARIGGILAFWDTALVPGTVADGNYGDITVSGTGTVWTINPGVVTIAKMADIGVSGHKIPVLDGAATTWAAGSTWGGEVVATKFSVGTQTEQGFNPAFVAKRTFGDFTLGSAHGFSDSSVSTSSTGASNAYASFEARIQVSGSGNYQHFVGLQTNWTIATSGTVDNVYGCTFAPILNNGTFTAVHGFRTFALRSTGGTIGTAYGFVCEDLGFGTTRYAFKSEGASDIVEFAGRTDAKNWVTIQGNANPPTVSGKALMFNFNAAFNSGAGCANIISGNYVGATYTEIFYDALKHNFRVSGVDVGAFTSAGLTLVTPLAVAYGGLGLSAATLGDLIYGSAANTYSRLSGNTTATKKWLTQTGTGAVSAAPSWSVITAGDVTSGAALTKTDDTNVTLTLGGAPTTALLAATSITAGWTGRLAYSRFVAATQKCLIGATAAGDFGEITLGSGVAITAGVLSATGAGGTVTTVSVITANGFSGAVANPTTTPAITLSYAGAALTKTDDTNVTLTLGGTPATALLAAASLTLGWTGTLAVTRGGTGLGSATQGDIIYASAANTYSALAKNTTASRYLSNSGTSNNPAWAQVDLTNGVTGTLPVANGGTGITSLGTGIATFLGTPSSANLAAAVTDETGSGALVFGTSPTIDGPTVTSSLNCGAFRNSGTGAVCIENSFGALPSGRTGQAIEIGNNLLQCYNRTTNAYAGFSLSGDPINLQWQGSTRLQITTNGADVTGRVTASTYLKSTAKTVGGLTAAATAGAGARDFVTDATATTFASAVTGGGANKVPVYCDGAGWFIG